MKSVGQPPQLIRFDCFEVNLISGELYKQKERIRLPEQSFQILAMLLQRPGEVVLRGDIQKKLWPNDTVVEFENSINSAIKRLRVALGDSADQPRYVETLPRRGYRWTIPVEFIDPAPNLQTSVLSVAPPAEPVLNLVGKRVSHYRVLEVIGGGGMGVVYKAEDLKLGRRVALKFLPDELAHDLTAKSRFEREARSASALNHPNICTIHAVEEHDGHPFIVMELLQGETLRDLIAAASPIREGNKTRDAIRLESLLDIAIQTLEGLNAAHQKSIIHRDIKPANIFITSHGQVKILDFGVAKLLETDGPEVRPFAGSESGATESSNLNLTRTGVALGTAGYMSPEQVRGEKVDGRTDLFSFGLVLYEMATGQRAFAGETAPLLHNAILNSKPKSTRELNPRIPAKLEEIVNKALEKGLKQRYQTAAEISSDLKTLKQQITLASSRSRWSIAAALILILGVTLWFVVRPGVQKSGLPEIKQRQLTLNSADHPIGTGMMSPSGKTLVYSDAEGLHLKLISSGETHALPLPDELKGKDIVWENGAWFPDSTRFIVNSRVAGGDFTSKSQGTSVWAFSIFGETPRKLREDAFGCAVSHDGSLISFETNRGRHGDREIWIMGPYGENPRRLFQSDEDGSLNCSAWSPDDKRVLYVQNDRNRTNFVTSVLDRELPILALEGADEIYDVSWLPDGRLIYSKSEPEIIGGNICNFWETRLDSNTGRVMQEPRRLTSWSGFCMSDMSISADAKNLAFLKWTSRFTTYISGLDPNGDRISESMHFTPSESVDLPLDWTPDGKTLILYSNRTGQGGIYRQGLDERSPTPIILGADVLESARITADGNWLLYLRRETPDGPELVMRISLAGGVSQLVSTARRGAQIVCARNGSQLCAIAEPTDDHRQLVITTLDPIKGRSAELTKFSLDPRENAWFVDVSPNATSIAAITSPAGPIYIRSLHEGTENQIQVKSWTNLRSVNWAANGKSLFVGTGGDGTILHVDFRGNAAILQKDILPGYVRAAPDGRHLAVAQHTMERNLWMMEKF
jgi:serine/threonine protein kinase